jgi:hypothetical protein
MDTMLSLAGFKKKSIEFIIDQGETTPDQIDEVKEKIEYYVEKTGGWEFHYQLMFEGVCSGMSFEEQLQKTAELWKTIKFRFGKE